MVAPDGSRPTPKALHERSHLPGSPSPGAAEQVALWKEDHQHDTPLRGCWRAFVTSSPGREHSRLSRVGIVGCLGVLPITAGLVAGQTPASSTAIVATAVIVALVLLVLVWLLYRYVSRASKSQGVFPFYERSNGCTKAGFQFVSMGDTEAVSETAKSRVPQDGHWHNATNDQLIDHDANDAPVIEWEFQRRPNSAVSRPPEALPDTPDAGELG